jgi:TATA-binding protein-associated factor Taf7
MNRLRSSGSSDEAEEADEPDEAEEPEEAEEADETHENTKHNSEMLEIVDEISNYEISEEQFRRSCCTAYDLCNHTVTIKIPQNLWFKLKDYILAGLN